ncbi:four-carbon acid sugar kinase family protein [Bacteroides sp. 214]|uniref:four-carbon acid sugar kinase family protein n=1 Tax=Bacteroides sp. 214 TaxID=2302935 RepID=UPI0013D17828|nr:four-carbon acid sugar kinase family protein [Bacteroides sp. 214]NDW12412.1 four-carbon acid sugar kinase family protein [Bacteroides sp. 214]
MITVIADDVTGAAEIAGIGMRFGLKVGMTTSLLSIPPCELLVCATDTRSMPIEEAISHTVVLAERLKNLGCHELFKKTDSALRGHIIAELNALMQVMKVEKALLIPQNPSKGRVIQDGVYYINGIPLDKTLFANDPEHPAHSAIVKEILGRTIESISIPNAGSQEEIEQLTTCINNNTIPAGGADFFCSYLKHKGYKEQGFTCFGGLGNRSALFICGSTANNSLTTSPYIQRNSVPTCPMDPAVFNGEDSRKWMDEVMRTYQASHSLVVTINQPSKGGKAFALRLKGIMATLTSLLLAKRLPQELIIEGGATAFAIFEELGCRNFTITDEVAPGVVRMQPQEIPTLHITIKPGSYPWGEHLLQ